MNGRVYYNEIDPHAAATLQNLVAAGEIPPGDVDTRDIRDVRPADLDGYVQCHFFAGVGVWARAFREARWPEHRQVWTGSCPCQPFSAAGAGLGFEDERHLWPDWHWLIEQCRPETVFGEQVASADGLVWADLVSADLEATDYAVGFVDTCAAGFRSFHIRQRLYYVADDLRSAAGRLADTGCGGVQRGQFGRSDPEAQAGACRQAREFERGRSDGGIGGADGGLGHADGARSAPWLSKALGRCEGHAEKPDDGSGRLSGCIARQSKPDRMAVADGGHARAERQQRCGQHRFQPQDDRGRDGDVWADPSDGYWRNADWLFCRDGVWRPVEPGTFPLVDATPARLGRLRAYGNAIDLAQATGFIRAYLERDMGGARPAVAGDLFEWGAVT